jgi:membrane protease YdiL (CAAX protease family)
MANERSEPQPRPWIYRIAALLEVLGVFVGGTLLARVASRGLELGPASVRALDPGATPDFVSLSASAATNLVLRYGLVLGLAFAIGWWHRHRRLGDYGLTRADIGAGTHLRIAVLLFAAAGILPLAVRLLPDVVPMGRAPAHWALLEDLGSAGIWLYLFVGSFGLVPIAEELLARGYIQTRLAEDFGAAAAILITAVFFTFSHTQYFILSGTGIGMLLGLGVGSLALGYVRYTTGSLIPGIVAHALGNLPFRGWFAPALLLAMLVVVATYRTAVGEYAAQLWRDVMRRDAILATIAGVVALAVVLSLIFMAPTVLPVMAAAALLAALALEGREKLRVRPAVPASRPP